jgi:hypothetical protein
LETKEPNKITILHFSKNIVYYMGDDLCFTNIYDNSYVAIFNSYSDYDRMMLICKYNSSFFEKKPDDKTIENIKECFFDLIDESDDEEVLWGWSNGEEHGFFPAYNFSDSLRLVLRLTIPDGNVEELNELFEDNKDKIGAYLDSYKVEFNYDKWFFDIIIDLN